MSRPGFRTAPQSSREHRCGEGFASQNSRTLLIGIGEHEVAEQIRIRWPSGRSTELGEVAAGSLVTVFETGREARIERY